MIRSFLTVSVGTFTSRLLGFARDSMIAALLGTAFVIGLQLAPPTDGPGAKSLHGSQ